MEKKKSRFIFNVYEWFGELAVAIVVMVLVCTLFFRVVTVNGVSMEPNFHESDRVLVTPLTAGYDSGDVVVIVDDPTVPMIKRIVATEGQTVDIDNESGVVLVDGVAFDDIKYNIEPGVTTTGYESQDRLTFPQTVPEGHVFVLGDNRVVSKDSRYTEIGMVDERIILGETIFKIFPMSDFGFVE